MGIKVYEHNGCSTCKKALRFLDDKKVDYQAVPIVDTPPSLGDLRKMIEHLEKDGGSFKNLFNTSGVQYRELGIAQKLKDGMTEIDALKLLASNGKLIKRPFVLTDKGGTVGFKEDVWIKLLAKR